MATVILGDFEWDDAKAAANLRKHGVEFEEAATAVVDPRAIAVPDFADETRIATIGLSAFLRVLFVVFVERSTSGRLRIISARKASAAQRRLYEEG